MENTYNQTGSSKEMRNRTRSLTILINDRIYDKLSSQAAKAHVSISALIRSYVETGEWKINIRKPAEMEKLDKIFDHTGRILETDMEILRQLRLTGEVPKELTDEITRRTAVLQHLCQRLDQ